MFAPGHLGELAQQVPFEMIAAVPEQTRRVQRRVRDLPARVVVYMTVVDSGETRQTSCAILMEMITITVFVFNIRRPAAFLHMEH